MFMQSFEELLKIDKKFVRTGCLLLDLALGGGVLRGTVFNVAGEESSGKTLLGVSMGVQVQRDGGVLLYDDSEGTLDVHRAVRFGLDVERSFYVQSRTLEKLYGHLVKFCKYVKEKNSFGLYVLDSLDALHTRMSAEAVEKITAEAKNKGSEVEELDLSMRERLDKSMVISWLLSVVTGLLKDSDVTLVVISQVRQRIGVVFGDKWDISGGKALKFYSSQRLYLHDVEKIKEKDVVVGIWVEGVVKKNKVAPPFRKVVFPVYFDRGIDDVRACLEFLKDEKVLEGNKWGDKGFRSIKELSRYIEENEEVRKEMYDKVVEVWNKKYEG